MEPICRRRVQRLPESSSEWPFIGGMLTLLGSPKAVDGVQSLNSVEATELIPNRCKFEFRKRSIRSVDQMCPFAGVSNAPFKSGKVLSANERKWNAGEN